MGRREIAWLGIAAFLSIHLACNGDAGGAISIRPTSLAAGTIGQPYRAELSVLPANAIGVQWQVSQGSLPPGIVLEGNGATAVLQGTPEQVGSFAFQMRATSGDGASDRIDLVLAVGQPFQITTLSLPAGTVGVSYSEMLESEGGSEVSWSVAEGTLPRGLELSSQGDTGAVLEGVPMEAGTFRFTVQAEDDLARTAERIYDVSISGGPLEIVTVNLDAATVGTAYRGEVSASGGTRDGYQWAVVEGALPGGLALDPEGTPSTAIVGTATAAGRFDFTIEVTDSLQGTARRNFTLTVNANLPVLVLVEPVLPVGEEGLVYTATLTASGGSGAYTWSIANGALPPGLSLESMGMPSTRIVGTPQFGGDFSFTARVTDAAGQTADRTLTIRIIGELRVVTADLAPAAECRPYAGTIVAGGDPRLNHTWTATVPVGMRLDTTANLVAELVGAPVRFGPQSIFVSVTDGVSTSSASLTLDVRLDPEGRRWIAIVGDIVANGDIGVHVADICGERIGLAEVVSPLSPGIGDASPTATDQIRFAPGGRALGFVGDFRLSTVNELFVVNLDPAGHGEAVRVSADQNPGGLVSDFRWSPDGSRIVYRADQNVDSRFELFHVDLASPTDAVQVNPTFGDGNNVFTDDFEWSADGRWLAYQADGVTDGDSELYLADTLSGPPFAVYPANRPLPDGGDVQDDFEWLPDAGGILFRADMVTDTVVELFFVSTATASPGAPRRVNGPLPSGADVASFRLRPDGTAVAYLADETTNGTNELYVATIQGGVPQPSVRVSAPLGSGGNVEAFRWSADGQQLLYVADGAVDDRFELYLIDGPDLSRVRPISGVLPPDGDVRAGTVAEPSFGFSPDRRWAAFVADSESDEAEALHVVDLTSSSVETLVEETFADDERMTQDPPSSLSWVSSGGQATLTVASGAMTLDTSSGARHTVAHFPRQPLEVGERLTLAFDFSVTTPLTLSNGMRIGLFDSGGTPVIVSDASNPDVTHEGYATFTNLVPTSANPLTIRQRDGAVPERILTTAAAYGRLAFGGPQDAFEEGVVYRATFTVARIGEGEAELVIRYSGGSLGTYELAHTDREGIVSTFDGLAIAIGSISGVPGATSITVDNLTLVRDGGLGEPVVVAPVPVATSTIVDFAFSPDARQVAFRAVFGTNAQVEVFAASLEAGAGFAMGNVLHGVLPAGATMSDVDVNLGWTRDSRSVIAVGNLGDVEVVEAWALPSEGGQAPRPLHAPPDANGDVVFVVIPK